MDDLSVFKDLWKGGYFEGDPLDPHSASSYGNLSYMSILHATYLRCIKPFINPEVLALEIGPGRGAWSKCMLGFKELYAIDPVSAEDSGFNEYVGVHSNIHHVQITDFLLDFLEDRSIGFVFSFGCLCHVSFEGITAYAQNMFPKLKSGANCLWMIADQDKFKRATGENIPSGGVGGWHNADLFRTCDMLEEVGYDVEFPDVGTCLRDPIIQFRKD
jgi:hypothetical protein